MQLFQLNKKNSKIKTNIQSSTHTSTFSSPVYKAHTITHTHQQRTADDVCYFVRVAYILRYFRIKQYC